MTTKREAVLAAFHSLLAASLSTKVLRNEVLPERIPAGGLVILRDGDPGQPEALLSPLTWLWEHKAMLEVFAIGATAAERGTRMDAVLSAVGIAVEGDRTLGGLCDWVQPQAPAVEEIAEEGVMPIQAATVPILLVYASADPLG
ncbi:MAG: acyl-CoA transferase [Methylobacterium mesophilicum]|nr:acyl-CoA transferase [Methylobacterium mesophilicum]